VEFARTAQRYGLDVYFTEFLYIGESQQVANLEPYAKAYVGGPVRYGASGEVAMPAPLERRYWLGLLLAAARFYAELSLECPNVKGFLFDEETYAPEFMWRNNSSLDDQTFTAVLEEMRKAGSLTTDVTALSIPREQRWSWLESQGLIKAYLEAQEGLVYERIARPFRTQVDKINPRFQLGFYPCAPNWFYHAWARGDGPTALGNPTNGRRECQRQRGA